MGVFVRDIFLDQVRMVSQWAARRVATASPSSPKARALYMQISRTAKLVLVNGRQAFHTLGLAHLQRAGLAQGVGRTVT